MDVVRTFVVVSDGAYGISFTIVRCLSPDAALNMVCGDDQWHRSISHVVNIEELIQSNNPDFGIIYEQLPTSG